MSQFWLILAKFRSYFAFSIIRPNTVVVLWVTFLGAVSVIALSYIFAVLVPNVHVELINNVTQFERFPFFGVFVLLSSVIVPFLGLIFVRNPFAKGAFATLLFGFLARSGVRFVRMYFSTRSAYKDVLISLPGLEFHHIYSYPEKKKFILDFCEREGWHLAESLIDRLALQCDSIRELVLALWAVAPKPAVKEVASPVVVNSLDWSTWLVQGDLFGLPPVVVIAGVTAGVVLLIGGSLCLFSLYRSVSETAGAASKQAIEQLAPQLENLASKVKILETAVNTHGTRLDDLQTASTLVSTIAIGNADSVKALATTTSLTREGLAQCAYALGSAAGGIPPLIAKYGPEFQTLRDNRARMRELVNLLRSFLPPL